MRLPLIHLYIYELPVNHPFSTQTNAYETTGATPQQLWWSILIDKCAFPIVHTQESHLHISTPILLVNQIIKHQLQQKRSWHPREPRPLLDQLFQPIRNLALDEYDLI